MSRVILNDHPWSDEEIEYQQGRNRIKEIAKNREMFPRTAKVEKLELDDDIVDSVKALDDDEVAEKLESLQLSVEGEPKQRKFRLAEALQKERNASRA